MQEGLAMSTLFCIFAYNKEIKVMSKAKTRGTLLAMMAMASQYSSGYHTPSNWVEKESKAKKATQEEINKANGLKEFIIDDKPYWAINYKNALKKSNKK